MSRPSRPIRHCAILSGIAGSSPAMTNSKRLAGEDAMNKFLSCVAGIALLALFFPAAAQNFPSRPITMIVPFAPGGPADVLGRLIGEKMSEDLGQQVIIDNRPGANTIIGAQAVAKAKPDGYTILLAIDGTLVMNPFLYSKLSYDSFLVFVLIALVVVVLSVFVV